MKQPLRRWPESDLDLGRDTGRAEPEDVARAVVTGHGGDSRVLVRDVSPQVWVPSAERSNSTQPQKPPVSSPHKAGLLQLNEIPTCHMSWLAPPP
jgi:hypothetical protein